MNVAMTDSVPTKLEQAAVKPDPLRRTLLQTAAMGFGGLALADLVARESAADGSARRSPLFLARVNRVIFLFLYGGPSHVDTSTTNRGSDKTMANRCHSPSLVSSFEALAS